MKCRQNPAKKIKLLISLPLLFLAFILSIMTYPAEAAEAGKTELSLTASKLAPAVGDTVTVTVKLSGNTGFAALQFDITYDTAVLSCIDCQRGSLLKDATLAAANPKDDGAVTVAAATLDEIKDDGVAAVVTFKVVGQGDAKLALLLTEICDSDYKTISCAVNSDRITAAAENGSDFSDDSSTTVDSGGGDWDEYTETNTDSEAIFGDYSGATSGSSDMPVNPDKEENINHLFSDTSGHWAESDINSITSKGIITGFEDGSFRPNDKMTRAQFAVILWRMAGKPEPENKSGVKFKDIKASWYEKAVSWAAEKGYINGDGDNFLPDNNISRQELVTILFRYSGGVSGMELMLTSTYDSIFKDSSEVASWGKKPIYWAIFKGIITGVDDTTLSPNGKASRGQVASIIARFLN